MLFSRAAQLIAVAIRQRAVVGVGYEMVDRQRRAESAIIVLCPSELHYEKSVNLADFNLWRVIIADITCKRE